MEWCCNRSSSVQTVIDIAQPIDLTLERWYIRARVLKSDFVEGLLPTFHDLREDKDIAYGIFFIGSG